jgi:hypothetical protein
MVALVALVAPLEVPQQQEPPSCQAFLVQALAAVEVAETSMPLPRMHKTEATAVYMAGAAVEVED